MQDFNPNINKVGGAQPNQPANPQAKNLRPDSFELFSSGELSGKDVNELVEMMASRLQIPKYLAFRAIRKFVGTGQASSFSELKNFLTEYLKDGQQPQQTNKQNFAEFTKKANQAKTEQEVQKVLRPFVREMADKFVTTRQQSENANRALLFSRNVSQVPVNPKIPLTELVSSPKAFASWLVNNKAAFISLKANPQFTYLLSALQNPQIQQSPVLLSEIAKLLAQLLKLRQGSKPNALANDEEIEEEQEQIHKNEAADHESAIVHSIRQVVEATPIKPLRDFLIEAERFAEEEMANLWSLALKREKELEEQIKKQFKDK